MSGEIVEGSAVEVEPSYSVPRPPSRPKPLYPQPSCGGDLFFEGRAASAPPLCTWEALRRSLSLLLTLFLLTSSVPVFPVAASPPSPLPSTSYPLFENTENAGGVVRLLPGCTQGSFVSEIF
ncbi:MAG: hypothetical protein QXQ55_05310, partial [Candidatus Hadarchaeales archaeon]